MADGSEDSSAPLWAAPPGANTSIFAAMQQALQAFQLNSDQMLPATVIAYDREKNIATVRPLIAWLTVKNDQIPRKAIAKIPVLSIGGGAFHISFPLKAGDLGWIFAADRDISLFLQYLKEQPSATGRLHSFSSGLFIPDVFRNYSINAEDDGALVIQSVNAGTRISVRDGNIKITAPDNVTIDTPNTIITGNLEVKKDTKIDGNTQMVGDQTVSGMTSVNGGFSAAGGAGKECSLPATATVNGTNIAGHGHQQQNGGSGRTAGGMIS